MEDPTLDPAAQPLNERARLGLLDYLTAHALDEDYAYVSARRASGTDGGTDDGGRRTRRHRPLGAMGAVALAIFAMLVVVAAVQTARNASADSEERTQLAAQVRDAREQLATNTAETATLRSQLLVLERQQLSADGSSRRVLATLRLLGTKAGTLPVRGPGVRVVADDAPGAKDARGQVLDSDLQKLVNGLWAAGAEAISLNGQRLTNLSTIREAGGAITVNAHSLRHPYVVNAIGNKDTLPARFAETTSGQAWLDLQREVGLRLTITPEGSLRLPAADVTLRYAHTSRPGGKAR